MLGYKRIESGNTVRYLATFYDFNEELFVPDVVLFRVYDRKYLEIESNPMQNVLDENGVIKKGEYYYDYTPTQQGDYTIELYGIIDNKPSLKREKIRVVFDD